MLSSKIDIFLLNSSKKLIIFLSLLSLGVYHNVFLVTFGIGVLLNFVLCKILKKLLKQSRPVVDLSGRTMKSDKDGGMPSRTTSMLTFYTTFLTLAIFGNWQTNFIGPLVGMLCFCFANIVVRFQYKYHTVPQMLVGLFLGFFGALVWFQISQQYLNPQLSQVLGGSDLFSPLPPNVQNMIFWISSFVLSTFIVNLIYLWVDKFRHLNRTVHISLFSQF